MKKTFPVCALKSLSRKQSYVIVLDFDRNTVSFHKVRRGKEVKRVFPVQSCVKLDKHQKDGQQLTVTFGHDPPYKKTIFFKSLEERELFCNLVHAVIVTGNRAYKLFKSLDRDGNGALDPSELGSEHKKHETNSHPAKEIDFFTFLISFSSAQTQTYHHDDTSPTTSIPIIPSRRQTETTSAVHSVINQYLMDERPDDTSTEIQLLDAETVVLHQQHTSRLDIPGGSSASSRGSLYLTNYRLIYRDYHQQPSYGVASWDSSCEMPLASILKVQKFGPSQSHLRIYGKDYRRLEFAFDASNSWVDSLIKQINAMAFPRDQTKLFAYRYRYDLLANGTCDGWTLYNPLKDYERIRVTQDKNFRLVQANVTFELCDSYPPVIVVPAVFDDDELKIIASYRSKERLPAVVWQHPVTKASLSRCAQPLVGLKGKRSEMDEKLFTVLREVNPTNSDVLYIIDARPYKAAMGNTVMGKGYENTTHYEKSVLCFMNIDNIHAIRGSLEKLVELCSTDIRSLDDATFLSKLEATQWLHYVRLLLSSAARIAVILAEEGASCVTHCSDGWDRTSQLSSLAQLMLDPYYRSLEGFAILIEKEWLSFGHMFGERHGHADPSYSHDQRAPIFLHWLDAVYQLIRQYPLAFEFNEFYLIEILDHVCAARFGTFLFNCMRERHQHKLYTTTTSLWSYLLAPANRGKFTNPFYDPSHASQSMMAARLPKAQAKQQLPSPNRNASINQPHPLVNGKPNDNQNSGPHYPTLPLTTPGTTVVSHCIPNCSAKRIVLWERLHLRWESSTRAAEALQDRSSKLINKYKQLITIAQEAGLDVSEYIDDSVMNSTTVVSTTTHTTMNGHTHHPPHHHAQQPSISLTSTIAPGSGSGERGNFPSTNLSTVGELNTVTDDDLIPPPPMSPPPSPPPSFPDTESSSPDRLVLPSSALSPQRPTSHSPQQPSAARRLELSTRVAPPTGQAPAPPQSSSNGDDSDPLPVIDPTLTKTPSTRLASLSQSSQTNAASLISIKASINPAALARARANLQHAETRVSGQMPVGTVSPSSSPPTQGTPVSRTVTLGLKMQQAIARVPSPAPTAQMPIVAPVPIQRSKSPPAYLSTSPPSSSPPPLIVVSDSSATYDGNSSGDEDGHERTGSDSDIFENIQQQQDGETHTHTHEKHGHTRSNSSLPGPPSLPPPPSAPIPQAAPGQAAATWPPPPPSSTPAPTNTSASTSPYAGVALRSTVTSRSAPPARAPPALPNTAAPTTSTSSPASTSSSISPATVPSKFGSANSVRAKPPPLPSVANNSPWRNASPSVSNPNSAPSSAVSSPRQPDSPPLEMVDLPPPPAIPVSNPSAPNGPPNPFAGGKQLGVSAQSVTSMLAALRSTPKSPNLTPRTDKDKEKEEITGTIKIMTPP